MLGGFVETLGPVFYDVRSSKVVVDTLFVKPGLLVWAKV